MMARNGRICRSARGCVIDVTIDRTEISFIEDINRERFLRRTRLLRSVFYCVRECVLACVRACSRACVRERNTEKFGLSSSFSPPPPPPLPPPFPPHPPLPLLRLFRPLFLPLASHSPEAKEARVLLWLTFSGMNYLARQVSVLGSRCCDFATRRRNIPLCVRVTNRRRRICRVVQLSTTLLITSCSRVESAHQNRYEFNEIIFILLTTV